MKHLVMRTNTNLITVVMHRINNGYMQCVCIASTRLLIHHASNFAFTFFFLDARSKMNIYMKNTKIFHPILPLL